MKIFIQLFLFSFFFQLSQSACSQPFCAFAVGGNGILLGNYKATTTSETTISDTITLADAKSIFAINAVLIEHGKLPEKVQVKKFQMSIRDNGNVSTIKGNSDMLSVEMKNKLQTIHSGANIFFEGIMLSFNDGSGGPANMLSFTVK